MSFDRHRDRIDDEDRVALIYIAAYGLPLLLGSMAWILPSVQTWMVEKGILVASGQALWVLPGLSAGLDLARIVIVAAVVVLAVAAPLAMRPRRGRR